MRLSPLTPEVERLYPAPVHTIHRLSETVFAPQLPSLPYLLVLYTHFSKKASKYTAVKSPVFRSVFPATLHAVSRYGVPVPFSFPLPLYPASWFHFAIILSLSPEVFPDGLSRNSRLPHPLLIPRRDTHWDRKRRARHLRSS